MSGLAATITRPIGREESKAQIVENAIQALREKIKRVMSRKSKAA